MASSDRPSGLTALAVINFIFGTLEFLGGRGFIVIRFVAGKMLSNGHEMSAKEREGLQVIVDSSWINVGIVVALAFATGLLLLLSGIGYLKQKRVLGRWFGNGYGIVAITYVTVSLTLLPEELTEGFSIGVIRSLIYPCFTMVLLNSTFRRDLAR